MFRLSIGVAKGRRGRFHAAFKHPGHLGKLRWLVLFQNEAQRMNQAKIILSLAVRWGKEAVFSFQRVVGTSAKDK